MKTEFSRQTRQQWFDNLEADSYDLIVIGGGITGAGILLDATSRGMKTLLVEMQDYGAGTSSRSTKLVHGGIRYLKQKDFKLVAEVGKERAVVRNNARHLVHPIPVMVPIYKGGSMKKWELRLGMWLFEWLVRIQEKFLSKSYNKTETLKREPTLNPEHLVGSVKYFENRTDDARLTLENIKTAVELGAKALNYVKAEEFVFDAEQKIAGAKVVDQLTGESQTVKAKNIISAAGPWVDDVRERDDVSAEHKLVLTKGVHLVFKNERLPINNAVYFDTHDNRMAFAVPAGDITYLGTTDTFYKGDLADPDVTEEDISYLLKSVNLKFPSLHLTNEDIISTWSGLRPLINEEGKQPSEISRKEEVFIADSGLISIAGGKLTGYRKMAEKATDLVAQRMKNNTPCNTANINLVGGQADNEAHFYELEAEALRNALKLGLAKKEALWLLSKYGTDTFSVLNYEGTTNTTLPTYLAMALSYSRKYEMVMTEDDFTTRRSSFSFFEPDKKVKYGPVINDLLK